MSHNNMSLSLPSKVPVELSVALVLFFFFLLAASGMFTGWLFSKSVAKERNQKQEAKRALTAHRL